MNSVIDRFRNLSPEKRTLARQKLQAKVQSRAGVAPLAPRAKDQPAPLSFPQQRLWFLDQMEGGSAHYNEFGALRITGRLDVSVLSQSINHIICRHEVLRTTFAAENGVPVQIVHPPVELPITVVDLSNLSPRDQQAEIERRGATDAQLCFDLTRSPLLRMTLLRLAEQSHVLLLTIHHIVCDLWSMAVLNREFKRLYAAFSQDLPADLPLLSIQYADFACWQRAQHDAARQSAGLVYWRQRLAGAPSVLELPYDRPRPVIKTYQGRTEAFELDAQLASRLKQLGQHHGCTLFMTLLAAFKVLVSRWTGQTDLVIGSPVANRNQRETEALIGFFVNNLVLRTDLSGNPCFCDFLHQVRQVCLDAYQHQEVPFEQIVESIQPERNLSYTPLFQVVFSLQNATPAQAEIANLIFSPLELDAGTAKFDLNMLWEETAHGLAGRIEYSTDLFDAGTIRRFQQDYRTLLEHLVAKPEARLLDIPLISTADYHQQLIAWNGQPQKFDQSKCIHELFEERVKSTPHAIAVTFEEAELTYAQLNSRANQLAHQLRSCGVGPEVLVGLCAERSFELVIGLLGILKAGGAYLPLDPDYPSERLAFMLDDARVAVVVTQESLVERLSHASCRFVCLDRSDNQLEQFEQFGTANPASGVGPQNLAYVTYTSGSTGSPKGALVTHENVTRLMLATESWFHFDDQDVWTLFHSYAFDFSVWEIWGALLYGGRLVVVPSLVSRSPDSFHALLVAEGITVLNQTPSAFRQLVQVDVDQELKSAADLRLRLVIFGGEALDLASVKPWFDRHGDQQPRLVNMYGITETTVHVTYRPLSMADLNGCGSVIGRAIPDLQLFILNERLQPAPIGVAGEIYVGGAGLARGYLRRAELSAERFIPSPFENESGARLYKTGDLARFRANGDIEYLGRTDSQVKIRGFRIELGEIESRLSQHPNLSEAIVLMREDEQRENRLVAYIVPVENRAPAASELRRFLQEVLPEYMVPAWFVTIDRIPLTHHGKLDRRALPAPSGDRPDLESGYVVPATPEEEVLAGIFAEVLAVDRVGACDNFFDSGGDSIRSIRVLAKAKEHGLKLSLQQFFQHQTVRELAAVAQQGATRRRQLAAFDLISAADQHKLPDGVEDAYPLASLQAGMLYHTEYNPDSAIYHDVFSYHLRAPLEVDHLYEAAQELVARHPILRTSIAITGFSQPLQLVHQQVEAPLEILDLEELPSDQQETAVEAFIEAEKRRSFDWSRPPLFRLFLHRRAPDIFNLTLSFHHAIMDGWSVASALTELFQHYYRLMGRDAPESGPPPAVAFRDFIDLEQSALADETARAYWRERLAGISDTRLPRWLHPADQAANSSAGRLDVIIPLSISDQVKSVARQAGVPLKSVLLAAHLRVLSLLANQSRVVTGLAFNGRPEEAGGDQTLGLFLNMLPLSLDVAGADWTSLAQKVFQLEQEYLAVRRFPLAEIQKECDGQTLFETAFNFVHFHVYEGVLQLGGLEVLGSKAFEQTNFALVANFNLDLETKRIQLSLGYDAQEFSAEQLRSIAGYYRQALQLIGHDPYAPCDAQSLLSDTERQRILVEWTETSTPYARHKCVQALFEEQVQHSPDAVAAQCDNQCLSYQELNARANQLAHLLREHGVGPEVCVGLCVERSLEMVVALLGILKAGGAYVPLDADYPRERLSYMLGDCQVPVLITQTELASKLPPCSAHVICLDTQWEGSVRRDTANPGGKSDPDGLAYVMYTSGSTGRPKGVRITHRNIVRLVKETNFARLAADETFLQMAPISFDASTLEIWGSLINGGRLAIMPPTVPTLDEIGRAIRQYKVTTLWLTAGLFHLMVDERLDDLRPLRQLIAGGDVLSVPHVERVLRELPGVRLINGYGPTEGTTFTCCHAISKTDCLRSSVPIGRPIANTQVYVLGRDFNPVPIGTPGELYVGGDGVARDYHDRPALTAETFLPNPFNETPGTRLYKTGDRVRYSPGGSIEFLGREDGQVKIRGFRVELGEIEAALARHPDVKDCVAIIRPHESNQKAIVAYATSARELAPTQLREFLAARLPDYMLPDAFVFPAVLPLNANGKVDRQALPELDKQPAREVYVAPRTPTQRKLEGIWSEVLRLDRVGVNDDFLQLGGHSLLATQLVSRIREAFEIELPLRQLFEAPTIARLAEHVDQAQLCDSGPIAAVTPVSRHEALPLSFAQERLWFLYQLEPENPFYNVPFALELRGSLHVDALRDSLSEIARRHEVLRTSFESVAGSPIQVIADEFETTLPIVALQDLDTDARAAATQRLAMAEALRTFDLSKDALMRGALLKRGPEDHVLLLTMHHIVADGWSLGILIRELAALYQAYSTGGGPAELPPLAVQYADFACWQRQWLQGEVLQSQLNYWKRRLAGAPAYLELPTDRGRPPVQSFQGSSVQFVIGADVTRELNHLSRSCSATLYMTLLSAFATLLSRYSGQDDIVIGSPVANRTRGEIEQLIGFFVNTLAMRVDVGLDPTFVDLVDQVRQTALDAYAHQDLPFEKLVDEIQPQRSLSQNPLFQVMFALQNAPADPLELPGLNITPLNLKQTTAIFDLVLDVWETDETLTGVLQYNTDLFDESTVNRMVGHLETLLEAVVREPTRRVSQLPLLKAEEREALLGIGSGPRVAYPVDRTIHELFEEQVIASGDRVAAVHNGAEIRYAQLNRRANRIAHRLRRCGVERGSFVGILDKRGIDFLAAILGVLKAGGAFVPLDPAYPEDRLRHMIGDSQIEALITRSSVLKTLSFDSWFDQPQRLVCLDEGLGDESADNPSPISASRDLAYMLYTSGSTGLPKGAMIRHDGAINHIFAEFALLSFHPDSAFLQSAPSSSDISVWQFLAPVLCGARTVIADFETVCDPQRLFQLIRSECVTLIELVPIVMKGLLDHASQLSPPERKLTNLEWAMVTGETAPVSLVKQWFDIYPDITLVNAYGPTEAADDVSQHVLQAALPPHARTVPIGVPLANMSLYVLDRNLQLVPPGVPGEICVSGIGVGAGYWQQEQLTNFSFVPNPYSPDERGDVLYRTGDLGRWSLGETQSGAPHVVLECLDRLDHQIKIRGFRIELGEIEAALGRCPWVHESIVDVCEHEPDEKRLVAYLVPSLDAKEVRSEIDGLKQQQIDLWQELHESSYRDSLDYGDPSFNVIGWDSNYTNAPLPIVDMHEYVNLTVERILALEPRNVLEIGCGTGLIMFPLLAHCASYVGTDLSEVAITRLTKLQESDLLRQRFPGLEKARLSRKTADDMQGFEDKRFDTVLLPSVVQYFPSVHYLLTVLQRIINGPLRTGGSIFLGDVRNLQLLETFHASVQLYKAADDVPLSELSERVRRQLHQEQELAIDPTFFAALKHGFPQIQDIEILPKRGFHHNEMTRFRYDVVIRLASDSAAVAAGSSGVPETGAAIDWNREPLSLEQIRARLIAAAPGYLQLNQVANSRVSRDRALVQWMADTDRFTTAGELRSALDEQSSTGLEPEDLWALGHELPYRVDISFAGGHAGGAFDVVFSRHGTGAPAPTCADFTGPIEIQSWHGYANNPLQKKLSRKLVPRLREALKVAIPNFMIPSDFVVLQALPRTPVGKVDRKALPSPDVSQRVVQQDYVAPRARDEQILAGIWSEVLEIEQVGVTSNFFELGGHSLKATQVVSRIHRDLGVEVPLRDVFNSPTIAELAELIRGARGTAYQRIERQPDRDDYALSDAQRRLWVLTQIEDCSAAYNMPGALLLEGSIDTAAFQSAFDQVTRRHESLRTVFVVVDGEPRQRVLSQIDSTIALIDLSSEEHPEEQAHELARADAHAVFDLSQGPLVRMSLLKLNAERHVLLFNMHHIISDDWSTNVLVREFVQLYEAARQNTSSLLPILPIQYRDYAAWQNNFLASDDVAALRTYWQEVLAGELPTLELHTDFPRPPIKTYEGACLSFDLDPVTTDELIELGRGHEASLFMTLVAVVKVLLHRYTGQEDIILGFPIAGRSHTDLEDQIGLYINMLPLRDQLHGDMPFESLLRQVRETATGAFDHQAYPFDRLVVEVNLVRDVSRSPMFDVIVVLQNVGEEDLSLEGVSIRPFADVYAGSKYDLSFTCEQRGGRLHVNLVYNTDLFRPSRIEQIRNHFLELVKSVLVDPATPIGRLNILPNDERRRVLSLDKALPAAGRTHPSLAAQRRETDLVQWFEAQAEKTPRSVAVVSAPRESVADELLSERLQLTYAELNARANQLAHHLRELGVGPNVLVGIWLERSIDMVVGLLGILKAGGAYVPFDPNHPADRIKFMLEDAGVGVLITERKIAPQLPDVVARVFCLDSESDLLAQQPSHNLAPVTRPQNLAYVIYTSGSTGRPKGVQVTHQNVVRLFTSTEHWFGFGPADVWTLFHSFAFDFSVWELWGALLYGGRLVIVPYWITRSPDMFHHLLHKEKVTVLNQTPSAFRQLIHAEQNMDHVRDLDLRLVIFGGEALDLGSLKPWFDRHGDQHPRLVNMYGITETTVHVTYRPISIADLAHRGSPIGEPIGDLEILLLDAYQQPVPFGVAGEIYVGGAGVSRGYLNRPELTDERFVAHPFSSDPNARLYRSGDLARSSPDGGIEYLGRIDHQVQIRGFRVELGEIESVLKSHPQVRDALVSYDQSTGSGRLLAYLIPTLDEIPDATELRGYLKSRLPEYMLPAAFLAVTAFPLTPNGKIDTQALPLPDNSRREDSVRYESPRTELERTIMDVWKQVLQVTTLSIHDNVFDLGAHSLHIVQVHQRLKAQLGRELAVVELFRHPTIASLSQFLSANHATRPSAVEKVTPRVEQQRQARQRRQKERRLRK